MNEIKVITELCAEDRARIDKLTAALESLTAGIGSVGTPYAVNNVCNVIEATEPEKVETPAELQQKVISLVSSGKKDEVKKIIEQYAPRVSAIPPEKINEVWDKLTELEG